VDVEGPAAETVGSTSVTTVSFSGTTYTTITGEQAFSDDWTFGHTFALVGPEGTVPEPIPVDGTLFHPDTGAGLVFTLAPPGVPSYEPGAIDFGACLDPTWTVDVHHVTFDGGEISMTLRLGDNITQTAPGAFVQATGTLDGVAFDVREYFQLVYRPDHHHFNRHFAVVFDAPIGDVCALRVEGFDPAASNGSLVSTAGCDLVPTGTRSVIEQSAELGGLP
jgi:hypothetical protein